MHPIFRRDEAERRNISARACVRLARERPRAAIVFRMVFWFGVPQQDLAKEFGVHPSQITLDLQWALLRYKDLVEEENARYTLDGADHGPPRTGVAANGSDPPARPRNENDDPGGRHS